MAELEEGLFSFLTSQSPTIAGGRLYPLKMPDNPTLPAVVYTRISAPRLRDLGGPGGRASPRIQLDVYASTYSEAKSEAKELRQSLDGYVGLMGTVAVGAVTLESDQDFFEDDTQRYRVSMDFVISHTEG